MKSCKSNVKRIFSTQTSYPKKIEIQYQIQMLLIRKDLLYYQSPKSDQNFFDLISKKFKFLIENLFKI